MRPGVDVHPPVADPWPPDCGGRRPREGRAPSHEPPSRPRRTHVRRAAGSSCRCPGGPPPELRDADPASGRGCRIGTRRHLCRASPRLCRPGAGRCGRRRRPVCRRRLVVGCRRRPHLQPGRRRDAGRVGPPAWERSHPAAAHCVDPVRCSGGHHGLVPGLLGRRRSRRAGLGDRPRRRRPGRPRPDRRTAPARIVSSGPRMAGGFGTGKSVRSGPGAGSAICARTSQGTGHRDTRGPPRRPEKMGSQRHGNDLPLGYDQFGGANPAG